MCKHGLTICTNRLPNENRDASNLYFKTLTSARGIQKYDVDWGQFACMYQFDCASLVGCREQLSVWWVCSHGGEMWEKQSPWWGATWMSSSLFISDTEQYYHERWIFIMHGEMCRQTHSVENGIAVKLKCNDHLHTVLPEVYVMYFHHKMHQL